MLQLISCFKDGLDFLYKSTQDALARTAEIAKWFKQYASVEETYAKNLLKLVVAKPKKGRKKSQKDPSESRAGYLAFCSLQLFSSSLMFVTEQSRRLGIRFILMLKAKATSTQIMRCKF